MIRAIVAVLAAAIGLAGADLAAAQAARSAEPQASLPTTLVVPFENTRREGRVFWLGEAAAVLLADDLAALGVNAIDRDERRRAFDRLQVPSAAALTDATVIRIGQIVGAAEVVVGSFHLENETLIVRVRSIVLETGRVRIDVSERGPIPEFFATFERVARKMAPPSSVSSDEITRLQPSLPALENYIKGLLAETAPTAISYLNAALKLEPTFDRARLALWDVYNEQGDHQRALAALAPVPSDSRWGRRARFRAGLSQLNLKKFDETFAIFKALADTQATATVLNNLGVVQIQRGTVGQGGQAAYYFNKAAEADPNDPDYFFNLGYAYWMERDAPSATYWLREAVRRNPADGDAHYVLGAALALAGNAGEAAREKELARRLSSVYEQWEKRPSADAVPRGLERVKGDLVELPHSRRIDAALASMGQRDQRELAQFYLDRGRRLFRQESDREALVDLDRALYLSPYEAEAHLLVGRIHLRNNRVREAIDALKIALWSADTVEAHLALGEAYLQAKEPAAARGEAERALAMEPASAEARRLLERIGAP